MANDKYWSEEEKEANIRFSKYENKFPIVWLERVDFWKIFREKYEPQKRWLSKEYSFDAPLDELRVRIKKPPVFSPYEADFPGPVERWYGKISENLFLLTHYYGVDHNILAYEDKLEVKEQIEPLFKQFLSVHPYTIE
jgi:hypothetical protein